MRSNQVQELWRNNKAAISGWLHIPSGFSAEVMAHQGWDVLTIDMQHGLVSDSELVHMLTAISTTDVTPFVRVPWLEPGIIMKVLDCGSYGVICPMINSREECEKFVGACRYAPEGYRSTGPVRAVFYSGPDYHVHASETILTFAMIETQEAVDNLDEICSVDGLDAIYIGPSDLSVSLGGAPGGDQRAPEVMKRIEMTLKAAHHHGKKAGIHAMTAEYANEMIEKGFDLVTLSSDFRHMIANAATMLEATN